MDAYADRREANALTHQQTLLIVFGVLLPTFMGSLDQTILATALPTSDATSTTCTACRG